METRNEMLVLTAPRVMEETSARMMANCRAGVNLNWRPRVYHLSLDGENGVDGCSLLNFLGKKLDFNPRHKLGRNDGPGGIDSHVLE